MKIRTIRKLLIYVVAVYIAVLSVKFFRKESKNRNLKQVEVWNNLILEKIDGQEVSLQKISNRYKLIYFGSLQLPQTYSMINRVSQIVEEVNQKQLQVIPIAILIDLKDKQLQLHKEYLQIFFDPYIVLLGGEQENIRLLYNNLKDGSIESQTFDKTSIYFIDDHNRILSVFEDKQTVEEIQKEITDRLKEKNNGLGF